MLQLVVKLAHSSNALFASVVLRGLGAQRESYSLAMSAGTRDARKPRTLLYLLIYRRRLTGQKPVCLGLTVVAVA